jgi:hypothetical protein
MDGPQGTLPGRAVDETFRRLGGMAAGVVMVISGLSVVVDTLVHSHPEAGILATVGVLTMVSGGVILRLPWHRWPTRALLSIVPLALVLTGAFNYIHQNV